MNTGNSTGELLAMALIAIMKTFLFVFLLAGWAHAAERATTSVTGTHIARPVKRIGQTYDTPQSIRVIDRKQIEQSGASTVAQLLRRQPGIRVR